MRIILSHGLEGTPTGEKITRLAATARSAGFNSFIPDFQGMEFERRLEVLKQEIDKSDEDFVLAGSSLGSLLSIVAQSGYPERCRGMFLLAAAIGLGFEESVCSALPAPNCKTIFVHGWNDDIVPLANVYKYAAKHKSELILIDSDHRLNDSIPHMEVLLGVFLRSL